MGSTENAGSASPVSLLMRATNSCDFLVAEGVGQRQHRHRVLHLARTSPDGALPTRWVGESGSAQVGMRGFERLELAQQRGRTRRRGCPDRRARGSGSWRRRSAAQFERRRWLRAGPRPRSALSARIRLRPSPWVASEPKALASAELTSAPAWSAAALRAGGRRRAARRGCARCAGGRARCADSSSTTPSSSSAMRCAVGSIVSQASSAAIGAGRVRKKAIAGRFQFLDRRPCRSCRAS